MSRSTPFKSLEEIESYLNHPKIKCLECGRYFKSLATHLPRMHGMSHQNYKEKWGIPRRFALAGTQTREILAQQMRDYIDSGRLNHDHLHKAVEASRLAGRTRKMAIDDQKQRERVAHKRPGDHSRLKPGSLRADGRDADRAREYQKAYRALKKGDPEPMKRYKEAYSD